MTLLHTSPDGTVRPCKIRFEPCPFEDHFTPSVYAQRGGGDLYLGHGRPLHVSPIQESEAGNYFTIRGPERMRWFRATGQRIKGTALKVFKRRLRGASTRRPADVAGSPGS